MRGEEAVNGGHQTARPEPDRSRDLQGAFERALAGARDRLSRLHFLAQAPRFGEKRLARARQRDRARRAHQQLRAEPRLQRRDLLAHGALRRAEFLGDG
jgi:hypothetical protein